MTCKASNLIDCITCKIAKKYHMGQSGNTICERVLFPQRTKTTSTISENSTK